MYKLGIIGFGVVGKSVLSFLRNTKNHVSNTGDATSNVARIVRECETIEVWDKRALNDEELLLLEQARAVFVNGTDVGLDSFFQHNDFVVASPGIDLSAYKQWRHKIVCELDFFSAFFSKPVVAITGSVGKTTITRLLGVLANKLPVSVASPWPINSEDRTHVRAAIGGNIGIGMLDLVGHQQDIDTAIVELSSFQLEFSTHFVPAVAIYTNIYPNHLDRHGTIKSYCAAKTTMLHKQEAGNIAIFSHELLTGPSARFMADELEQIRSQIVVTSPHKLKRAAITAIPVSCFHLVYLDGKQIILASYENYKSAASIILVDNVELPDITFTSNWVQVIAGLYLMGLAVDKLPMLLKKTTTEDLLPGLGHRVHLCATVKGVDFYDDSKSTITQATLAAVERLAEQKRPIIVILGGLSKGIDRSWLMTALGKISYIKRVFCFGPESSQFEGAEEYETLEALMQAVGSIMTTGDIVLFSPSGTSFDFFKNYEHRGQVFEQLVQNLA